jgi:hypothetical protein
MIVFNLGCRLGHRFDGWFGSADDYEKQQARDLLECPVCGDKAIVKHLSAPRLNLGGGNAPDPSATVTEPSPGAVVAVSGEAAEQTRMLAAQTAFYRHLRAMLERSADVGDSFAEEARKIHYKEAPERQIHGVTTRDEAIELLEEGVSVLPLPFAVKRKGELN